MPLSLAEKPEKYGTFCDSTREIACLQGLTSIREEMRENTVLLHQNLV
jgi:hypothetical protein